MTGSDLAEAACINAKENNANNSRVAFGATRIFILYPEFDF
jgi:hypothetical protein